MPDCMMLVQDYKLKLTTLERRRLDYDADRRSIAKLELKRTKASEKNVALKPEVTTQLQAKEHTALGEQAPAISAAVCILSRLCGCPAGFVLQLSGHVSV